MKSVPCKVSREVLAAVHHVDSNNRTCNDFSCIQYDITIHLETKLNDNNFWWEMIVCNGPGRLHFVLINQSIMLVKFNSILFLHGIWEFRFFYGLKHPTNLSTLVRFRKKKYYKLAAPTGFVPQHT